MVRFWLPTTRWTSRDGALARIEAAMTVPNAMRAVTIREPGGAEVLTLNEKYPVPRPGNGEVLIRMAAAGVNRADVMQRQGVYPMPPGAPVDVPGLEVSGVIVASGGGVARWKIGDEVCALLIGNGYSEYVVAPAQQCMPVPAGVSLVHAGGLPETYCTVWTNLFERGRLAAGETVLIQGGTSGIGVAAIQLAKAFGARVLATAGSAEKCRACQELGADRAIDYRREDFHAVAKDFTRGAGVDVILDIVAGSYIPRELDLLKREGRLVFVAQVGGSRVEADFHQVLIKHLTVTGSTLRSRTVEQKGRLCAALEKEVWPLFARKELSPMIYRTFPLSAAADAHRLMESSAHIGKILLTP
jgi:NADPH2:quinone reductase